MSRPFLSYLEREHERLEQELATLMQQRFPDPMQVARLKKLKLTVKDQIGRWHMFVHARRGSAAN